MKKLLLTLLLLTITPLCVFAEDVSVDELLGQNSEDNSETVKALEQERTEEIENALNISVPEYTDNPSHIVTFVDPSEEKEGVELDIDEEGYEEITSPYSLPQLSIGEHHLKFRFVDSIGATKVLEYDLVVIPRPPLIKAPTFEEKNLVLSGTGLANGETILTVSVGANNYTKVVDINDDGNWNTSISMESVSNGIYTIFGYARKDGYASNPSEPAVFEYGDEGVGEIQDSSNSNIYFNFTDIELSDIPTILTQNPDLIIFSISTLLLGALVTSILFILIRGSNSSKEDKEISRKINGGSKEEKTLLELFGAEKGDSEGKKTEEKNKKDSKKKKSKDQKKKKKKEKQKKTKEKEQKRKEKIFTKHDFLKDFKNFDPDKDSGKEKKEPNKRDKKDVIVTLTSQKEDSE
jgi:hypothetical protein